MSSLDPRKPSPLASAEAPREEPPKAGASASANAAPAASSSAPEAPASSAPPFDKSAASAAVSGVAGAAAGCRAPDDPGGFDAQVSLTFAPSGRATQAVVSGRYAGTATGACIARTMKSASVPAFSGDPVTVTKSIAIP